MNEEADIIQTDEAFLDSARELETPLESPEGDIPEEEELTSDGDIIEETDQRSDAEELSLIRSEITKLKEELRQLDELKAQSQRMLKEFDEFLELFPDKRIESIPDEVWAVARSGSSLAAAYALYEKKREASQRLAEKVNAKNAALSAGKAGSDGAAEYFSYEQVRQMSQAEVRKNYTKIRESMKKWN